MLKRASVHRNFRGLTLGNQDLKNSVRILKSSGENTGIFYHRLLPSMVKAVGHKFSLLASWSLRGYRTSMTVKERKETDQGFGFECLSLGLWHYKVHNNMHRSSALLLPLWWVLLEVLEDRKIQPEWYCKAQQWNKRSLYRKFHPPQAPEQQIWHLCVRMCTCTWSVSVQLLQCVQSHCACTPGDLSASGDVCLSLWTHGMHLTLVWYGVDFCVVGGRLSEISRCSSC